MEIGELFINLKYNSDEFSSVYNQWKVAGFDQDGGTMRKVNTYKLY